MQYFLLRFEGEQLLLNRAKVSSVMSNCRCKILCSRGWGPDHGREFTMQYL